MTHSESIQELATALAKAQAKIKGATKDSANPYFKSKYADLTSVWEACRAAITAEGLSILQTPRLAPPMADSLPWTVEIETALLHSSGQWMRDTLGIPIEKIDAQGVGSAITYGRRYALAAFVGVAPEDDDGNAAVGSGKPAAKPVSAKPKGYDNWLDDIKATADSGIDALQEAWRKSPTDCRAYLTASSSSEWDAIKAKAMKVPA